MARQLVNLSDANSKRALIIQIGSRRGDYWMELSKARAGRSLKQNRWYWACIVPAFGAFLREQGEPYTDDEAHEMLKFKWLRRSLPDPQSGEPLTDYTMSTRKLTTEEMSNYCDNCRDWLADQFGIIVPDPDPAWTEATAKGEHHVATSPH